MAEFTFSHLKVRSGRNRSSANHILK